MKLESSMFSLAVAMLAASPAMAQNVPAAPPSDAPPADIAPTDTPATPGDIVVTGTRRATRLQDVPVSITAISADTIRNAGYKTGSDIQFMAPGVSYNPQLGAGFTIRGLGSQGFDYNLERAVGVVVDDVAQALPRTIGFNTFADVERIEVLKGPQGTLFGKNTSAGVIYVVTERPKLNVSSVEGSARYGSRNEIRFDNSVNIPISDTLAARITGVYQSQDGYLKNVYNNTRGGGYRDYGIKGKLLWQPTDNLEVYLIGDIQDHHDDGLGGLGTIRVLGAYSTPVSPTSTTAIDFPTLLAASGITPGPENLSYSHNAKDEVYIRQQDIQGQIKYRFGDYTLTSITAYTHAVSGSQFDQDQVQTNFYDLNDGVMDGHQFSQEVRLNSPKGKLIDYVVGAYFFDSTSSAVERSGGVRNNVFTTPNTLSAALVAADAHYISGSRSMALFGQGNLHLTDKLTFIGGLRFTHDRVHANYFPTVDTQYTFVGNVPAPVSGSQTVSNLSGKVTAQYKATENIMFYGTFSTGYKAPAIGTSIGTLRPVSEETVKNFELGARTQFFDRRLTVNATLFSERFDNFQTTTAVLGTDGITRNLLANAPHVLSRGVEADISLKVDRHLTIGGNISWTPTKYQGFLTSCYFGETVNATAGPGCYRLGTANVHDVTDLPSIQAPETTFNLNANYAAPINEKLRIYASANYYHRSSAYSVAGNPNTIVPEYGLLNGTIGIGGLNDNVRLSIYARNLLDKVFVSRIQTITFASSGSYLQYVSGEGRRDVGVRLDYRF